MAYGILTNFKIKSLFKKTTFFLFRILTYQGKMDPLETPLHKAVKAGNIQDVKMLFLHGVEINATDKFNRKNGNLKKRNGSRCSEKNPFEHTDVITPKP